MVTENDYSDSSSDTEESDASSITSSSPKVKTPRHKKKTLKYPSTAESSENASKTTESSLPTKSESTSDVEKEVGKVKKHKEFKKARKYIRKMLGTPDVAKKQTVSSINRQVLPRSTATEKTVKGRVPRTGVEPKGSTAVGETAKGRRYSVTQPVQNTKALPSRLQSKPITKTSFQRGETSLNMTVKKLTANSIPGGGVKTATTKKKTNAEAVRKKVTDDIAEKKSSGEPIAETINQREDLKSATGNVAKKNATKTNDAPEQLKKKKQPLDSAKTGSVKKDASHMRKVTTRKTEGQPRSVQPSSMVKTDGRSDLHQRKAEVRGSQGRTAFTMSGLRQGAAMKNLAKERIVGQSDQA